MTKKKPVDPEPDDEPLHVNAAVDHTRINGMNLPVVTSEPLVVRVPAHEELWFCPSCGRPAQVFVSYRRTLVCGVCKWAFDIALYQHFNALGPNPYARAKDHAEEEKP